MKKKWNKFPDITKALNKFNNKEKVKTVNNLATFSETNYKTNLVFQFLRRPAVHRSSVK